MLAVYSTRRLYDCSPTADSSPFPDGFPGIGGKPKKYKHPTAPRQANLSTQPDAGAVCSGHSCPLTPAMYVTATFTTVLRKQTSPAVKFYM
jgi:hypothetical protein